MATHNWCHSPKCHTYKTTDRVRGSGDNKVLRTRRVKIHNYQDAYYYQGWENHFCKVGCLFDYIKLHIDRIVEIAPVREPSETPIKVKKEKYESHKYQWSNDENNTYDRVPYMATRTTIVEDSNE